MNMKLWQIPIHPVPLHREAVEKDALDFYFALGLTNDVVSYETEDG